MRFRPLYFPFLPTFATLGIIPTDYKIALSYEEQLLWLCKHIEDIDSNIVLLDNKITDLRTYLEGALELIQNAVNTLALDVEGKQDKLIAGMNIKIEDNVISAKFLDEEDYTTDIVPDYIVPLYDSDVGDVVSPVAVELENAGYIEIPDCKAGDKFIITGNFILGVLDEDNILLEKHTETGTKIAYTLQNDGTLIVSFYNIRDYSYTLEDGNIPRINTTDVGDVVEHLVPVVFDDTKFTSCEVTAGNVLKITGKYTLAVLDSYNIVLEKATGTNGEYVVRNNGTLYINYDETNIYPTSDLIKVNPLKAKIWRTIDIVALLNTKQDKLIAGSNITLTPSDEGVIISATGSSGSTDYNDLTNKPSIDNVTLTGNKTLEELGINFFYKTNVFSVSIEEFMEDNDDGVYFTKENITGALSSPLNITENEYFALNLNVGDSLPSVPLSFQDTALCVYNSYNSGDVIVAKGNFVAYVVDENRIITAKYVPNNTNIFQDFTFVTSDHSVVITWDNTDMYDFEGYILSTDYNLIPANTLFVMEKTGGTGLTPIFKLYSNQNVDVQEFYRIVYYAGTTTSIEPDFDYYYYKKIKLVDYLSSNLKSGDIVSGNLIYNALLLKENLSNKVTSISASSTHAQYPSAKCVYDNLDVKVSGNENVSSPVTKIWTGTQAEYDLLTPDSQTLYFIKE